MTDKIIFRALTLADANSLFAIYSDKEAMKYRGSQPMNDIEDAKNYVYNQRLEVDGILTIRKGVVQTKDSILLGSVMYRYNEKQSNTCEIGYSIGRKFWGKGYGLSIVKGLLQDISEDTAIEHIIAWSHKENMASIKILERLGFVFVEEQVDSNTCLYRKSNKKLLL